MRLAVLKRHSLVRDPPNKQVVDLPLLQPLQAPLHSDDRLGRDGLCACREAATTAAWPLGHRQGGSSKALAPTINVRCHANQTSATECGKKNRPQV